MNFKFEISSDGKHISLVNEIGQPLWVKGAPTLNEWRSHRNYDSARISQKDLDEGVFYYGDITPQEVYGALFLGRLQVQVNVIYSPSGDLMDIREAR